MCNGHDMRSHLRYFYGKLQIKIHIPIFLKKVITFLRFIDDLFMIWTATEEELLIWTATEEELLKFINKINQKYKTIKFDFKYSKAKIEFLDVLVYKDINNKLRITLYIKPTDHQSHLHVDLEPHRSLKESMSYSQVLRVKRIYSTNSEFEAHFNTIKINL